MPAAVVERRASLHSSAVPAVEEVKGPPWWRREVTTLVALVVLAAVVRLPGVTRPLVGNFATKNVVYAMIARNFARGDAPWYLPTVDVLADGQAGWHLLEVPLSAYVTGTAWRLFGGSLEVWGRLTAIACSAAAVAWLYAAVRRTESHGAATMAACLLAISPVSVIYGQSFMLEPSAELLSIAAVDAFSRASVGGRRYWWILGAIALGAAALTKIYLALLVLPILATVRIARPRELPAAAIVCAVSLLPALLWCGYVWQLSAPDSPSFERIYYSLRASEQAHRWPSPALAEPQFYWGVVRDLTTVVLTPVGAALALCGVLSLRDIEQRKRVAPWLVWLLACVALVVLLPAKFQAMNYYWLITLPPLAAMAGVGWEAMLERRALSRVAQGAVFTSIAIAGLALAARPAFVTPPEDRAVVAAADAARRIVPPGEPIVASHGACPDLLYYCDRRGWAIPLDAPNVTERLRTAQAGGARYLVWSGPINEPSLDIAPLTGLGDIVAQGPGFAVIRLSKDGP